MCGYLLKASLFLLVFVIQNFTLAQIEIKSLRVYTNNDETSFPLLDLSSGNEFITIEFDVASVSEPNLTIIFRPCDSNWQPYENPFLFNPLFDKELNLWFDRMPMNLVGAQFHYKGTFPNNNVSFTASGKWKFFIVDSQDKNKIFATGKFYVVFPEVKLNVSLSKENLQGDFGDLPILGRTIAIKSSFVLPDSLFPSNVLKIEIIKNKILEYAIVIDRKNITTERFYEWDAAKKFSFIARNLKPGNEYRETDTRNVSIYNSYNVDARFGEFDIPDLFAKRKSDLDGASILMNWRNENSDYLNVSFRLKVPKNITKPIFLVGSFNNWQLLPEYEMYDDNGMMNLTIQLKRGLYDYQYVVADFYNDKITNEDWEILEGNFFETRNEYHIFLYYWSDEKGGYEKIIGYKKFNGGL